MRSNGTVDLDAGPVLPGPLAGPNAARRWQKAGAVESILFLRRRKRAAWPCILFFYFDILKSLILYHLREIKADAGF